VQLFSLYAIPYNLQWLLQCYNCKPYGIPQNEQMYCIILYIKRLCNFGLMMIFLTCSHAWINLVVFYGNITDYFELLFRGDKDCRPKVFYIDSGIVVILHFKLAANFYSFLTNIQLLLQFFLHNYKNIHIFLFYQLIFFSTFLGSRRSGCCTENHEHAAAFVSSHVNAQHPVNYTHTY